MKTINQTQLAKILSDIKGAMPLTISAFVDTKAKKTDNPYSEIRKLSKVNGFTGADYEASVARQQEREGKEATFEARDRAWGTRTSAALVENKGKKYLVIHPRNTAKPVYFARSIAGVLMQVKKEAIEKFLPKTYSAAPAQGVDKEVVYRNYALENITALSINGEKYRIRAN